ncbi:MAG: hypothetical protein R2718_04800 [Solirubrobacterales bacterium]
MPGGDDAVPAGGEAGDLDVERVNPMFPSSVVDFVGFTSHAFRVAAAGVPFNAGGSAGKAETRAGP